MQIFCSSLKKLFLALILLSGAGCQTQAPSPQVTAFQETVMTVSYRILVGHSLSELQVEQIRALIRTTFEEIDAVYNKWNPNSELSHLNRLKAGEIKPLSPSLFQFFQRIDTLVHLSHGRFDPTVEPLQKLWKSRLEQNQMPSEQEIANLKSCIGWDKIHFADGTFYKEDSRTQLDLGGIAKGWCVDLLVQRLNQAGFANLYVEWGGDIRTSGLHPHHRPWNVYISRLGDSDPRHALAYVSLKDQAIATSGDYFQYWTLKENGQETIYCHIFNPLTLKPLEVKAGSIASASLIADDCLTADGLAKVLMLFDSKEEAEDWIKQAQLDIPNLSYWMITR